MIKRKNKGDLIVISGPSGCGKDTICYKLFEIRENLVKSISLTTRTKRDYEIDGKDYYFVSEEEFQNKIKNGDLLEYAIVHQKDYYGTPKDKIFDILKQGKDIILIIDIQGALQVKEKYPEAIFIFILPPSISELKKRLIKRNTDNKEALVRRFKSIYKEINEINKYNYAVVNDNLDDAVYKTNAIIESQKLRVDRIEEFDLNSLEEEIHEALVDL